MQATRIARGGEPDKPSESRRCADVRRQSLTAKNITRWARGINRPGPLLINISA